MAHEQPSFRWQVIASRPDSPGPRSRHGLVYDRDAQATVLFGGIIWSREELCADTWELRQGRWWPIRTDRTPKARHRLAMVYLTQQRCSLLFGGQARSGLMLGDTWLYANRTWQRHRFWRASPSARCGHALAYDEQAGVAVLFGGVGMWGQPLGDTWLFDGTTWQRGPRKGPAPRRYPAFAYDPDLQYCVLHGGAHDDAGQETYGDTWLFKQGTWRLLSDHRTPPHDDHALAYHPLAKFMVLVEGVRSTNDLLIRHATGWLPTDAHDPPMPLQCTPMVWDESLGGLVRHGGELSHGGPQTDTTLLLLWR